MTPIITMIEKHQLLLCQQLLCLVSIPEGNAAWIEICNEKSIYNLKRINLCEGKNSKEYCTLF